MAKEEKEDGKGGERAREKECTAYVNSIPARRNINSSKEGGSMYQSPHIHTSLFCSIARASTASRSSVSKGGERARKTECTAAVHISILARRNINSSKEGGRMYQSPHIHTSLFCFIARASTASRSSIKVLCTCLISGMSTGSICAMVRARVHVHILRTNILYQTQSITYV